MHDTLLPGQTVLESFELIRSVMPLEVRSRDDLDNKEASKFPTKRVEILAR